MQATEPLEEILQIFIILIATLVGFTIAGVVGFGGGIIVLPILVSIVGLQEAVPILTISQLFSNFSRVWIHRKQLQWSVSRYFALGSLPLAVVGSFFLVSLETSVLVRALGVFMLACVVFTKLPFGKSFKMKLWGFIPVGGVTGFTSASMGVPGPFPVIFYLAYGMSASAFIGTSAIGQGLIHLPKLLIYGISGLITAKVLILGLGLAPIGFMSAFLGKLILDKIPPKVFRALIDVLLVFWGVLFIVRG